MLGCATPLRAASSAWVRPARERRARRSVMAPLYIARYIRRGAEAERVPSLRAGWTRAPVHARRRKSGRRFSAIGSAGQGNCSETYRKPSRSWPAETSRVAGHVGGSELRVTALTTAYSWPHSRPQGTREPRCRCMGATATRRLRAPAAPAGGRRRPGVRGRCGVRPRPRTATPQPGRIADVRAAL